MFELSAGKLARSVLRGERGVSPRPTRLNSQQKLSTAWMQNRQTVKKPKLEFFGQNKQRNYNGGVGLILNNTC